MPGEAQRRGETYSGIAGIAMQDASLQESMGPICDRTKENLVGTDNGIIMARHKLMRAAKALSEKGTLPPGRTPRTSTPSAPFRPACCSGDVLPTCWRASRHGRATRCGGSSHAATRSNMKWRFRRARCGPRGRGLADHVRRRPERRFHRLGRGDRHEQGVRVGVDAVEQDTLVAYVAQAGVAVTKLVG